MNKEVIIEELDKLPEQFGGFKFCVTTSLVDPEYYNLRFYLLGALHTAQDPEIKDILGKMYYQGMMAL